MMTNDGGFFNNSTVHLLCDTYEVAWYNTDLDRMLSPFHCIDLDEIDDSVLRIIREAVIEHLNTNQG